MVPVEATFDNVTPVSSAGARTTGILRLGPGNEAKMRDNHEGLPELITAFERENRYFGVVQVTIGVETRAYEIGLNTNAYGGFKKMIPLCPFDKMPGLYRALDWLAARQDEFERKLYLNYKRKKETKNILVLYDVTLSYLEGQRNEYGEYGYDRDKKKGKKQIVIGLLTGPDGEPLSVTVFKGNTSDPCTVSTQIATLKERFGIKDVVFVGDRGMVKNKGKQALFENGFKYITALTDPQVRKLLKENVIQLNLFDTAVCEVTHRNVRLVLRRNEAVTRKEARRRENKLDRFRELIAKRNEFVLNSQRADPEAGLRKLAKWAARHKLSSFVELSLNNNRIELIVDEHAQSEAGLLDGCYVMETDVSADMMDAETVDERYRSLHHEALFHARTGKRDFSGQQSLHSGRQTQN
jgi:hypothetical protein